MAEIKSTMDLVMERAARMGKASGEEMRQEEAGKRGMQLAVEFMEGKLENPLQALKAEESSMQMAILKGMASAMLRNVFLPRDEGQQEKAGKAVQGILALEGGSRAFASICDELTNILGGYLQHREQLRGQLEEQIRQQLDALMAQQPEMKRMGLQIDPARHPRFQEEWSRVETQLNAQYNNALNQVKKQIGQRLGI